MTPRRSLADRLFSRTVRTPSGCLEWQGSCLAGGYGNIGDEAGRTITTHRAAWIVTHGSIPAGMDVLHRCDNPPCVEPTHLFLGDQQVNMDDMIAKGRHVPPRGEQQGRSKLTEEQVKEIRRRYRFGDSPRLAQEFGVTPAAIRLIMQRRNWKHI